VLVDDDPRISQYERDAAVIDGGTATVTTKAWEVRARAVRKLVRKAKEADAAT